MTTRLQRKRFCYQADVISDKDPAVRFAQSFSAGTFAWFESGAVDDGGQQHITRQGRQQARCLNAVNPAVGP
jgi:hypothetical protein